VSPNALNWLANVGLLGLLGLIGLIGFGRRRKR